MAQTYRRFTYEQRCQLKSMLDSKTPVEDIANTLGFNRASVYREIKRGKVEGVYNSDYSEEQYRISLSQKGPKAILSSNSKLAQKIADYILNDHLSPKRIAEKMNKNPNEFFNETITYTTIYNAIDNGLIPGVTRENLRTEETKVFHNGNICLASWIREELNIKDGDMLHFEVTDDKKIVFYKIEDSQ